MAASCPWCGVPRAGAGGVKCPRCGAIYAKAEALRAGNDVRRKQVSQRRLHDAAVTPEPLPRAPAPDGSATWGALADDPRFEWHLRLLVVPLALIVAALINRSVIGHLLQRTFLSMMVHEAGHAVTSWFCGFAAFPALWVTYTSTERGALVVLALTAALGYLVLRGVRARNSLALASGCILLAAQLSGTFLISSRTAQALIVFGGDGGAMVLGTALMATFFSGRDTQIYKGWLRWGFLAIGSAGFVDAFGTWWAARTNADAIPFGANEGVGLSDPSKLMDVYGWSPHTMVQRYVALGMLCLILLALVWSVGVHRARREHVAATERRL